MSTSPTGTYLDENIDYQISTIQGSQVGQATDSGSREQHHVTGQTTDNAASNYGHQSTPESSDICLRPEETCTLPSHVTSEAPRLHPSIETFPAGYRSTDYSVNESQPCQACQAICHTCQGSLPSYINHHSDNCTSDVKAAELDLQLKRNHSYIRLLEEEIEKRIKETKLLHEQCHSMKQCVDTLSSEICTTRYKLDEANRKLETFEALFKKKESEIFCLKELLEKHKIDFRQQLPDPFCCQDTPEFRWDPIHQSHSTTECPKCTFLNSEDRKFCGMCSTQLRMERSNEGKGCKNSTPSGSLETDDVITVYISL